MPEAIRNRVKATLLPRRDKSDIGGMPSDPLAESLATRTATVAADGTVRFSHVRPDRYRLIVEGAGVPETALAFDVPDAGFDVGDIRIAVPTATGRIEGRVWHPTSRGGGVWAFAKGYVGAYRFAGIGNDRGGIAFQADENGRFRVEGVPVGLTTVGFPDQVFDVINSYEWSALVVAGQTTEVRAFDPDARRQFTLSFVVGDGSNAQFEAGTGLGASRKVEHVTIDPWGGFSLFGKKILPPREPMFRVDLVPVPRSPLSFIRPDWDRLDVRRKVVLSDVGPGTYRLRVSDWVGTTSLDSGPMLDREVAVPPGGQGEVRIPLGAGCITGKAPVPEENYSLPVEVTAVARRDRTPPRRTRCDNKGNFCVRYLTPGSYSLFIHNPSSGFCRVDDVEVKVGAVDVGERTLSPGATVRGMLRLVRPSSVPGEVVAVGPMGVTVRQEYPVYSSFDRIEIPHLWPGHWTVSARKGDEVIATGEVDVAGTGVIPVTLTAAGRRAP